MKKISNYFYALVAALIISSGVSYASFPVKNDKNETQVVEQKNSTNNSAYSEVKSETKISSAVKKAKAESLPMNDDKIITLILWAFLGAFAAHRWYKGKPAIWNVLFILTAGGCGVWAIVDLVNILTDNF